MTMIADCGVCSTLKELNLQNYVTFHSDVSVRKFADILATAPVLKKCDISGNWNQGKRRRRKIKVEVKHATEG